MMLFCFDPITHSEFYQEFSRNTTQPAMKLAVTLLAIASLASTILSQEQVDIAPTEGEQDICESLVRSQHSTSYFKQAEMQLS